MENEAINKLIKTIGKIAKDVRYGNFSSRIDIKKFSENQEIIEDINKMLESIEDRENMIKEYQNFLKQKSLSFANIFNNMREGILTLSEDYRILQINFICAKRLNISPNKLINKNIFDVLKKYKITNYPNSENTISLKNFFKQKRNEVNLKFEIDGIYRIFNISLITYTDINKNKQYLIVSKDITKELELENLKNTFEAALTHDLKVPILAQGNIFNLLNNESFGKLTPMQKDAVENLITCNDDLITLVSNLLCSYSIDDDGFKISKSNCDVKNILEDEIKKLSFFIEDCGKSVKLKASGKDFFAHVDRVELSRVFKNILSNAINYSDKNSIIKVNIKKTKTHIYITVENNGMGIKEGDLSKIFEKYYSAASKFRKVGSGLGLYLSKRIIELHGGEINVKSSPDVKTEFSIKLPV